MSSNNVDQTENILIKIAKDISKNHCGGIGCPCKEYCDVYSDQECIDRIMHWLRSVVEE